MIKNESRNELRKNTKAYVPPDVIKKMYNSFDYPHLDEGFYVIFKYNTEAGWSQMFRSVV